MEKIFNIDFYQRVHFIGVGGISMSAIAKFLLQKGIKVTGSDTQKTDVTNELDLLGVKVFYKHLAKNVKDAQAVIYSSAIDAKNQELCYAKEKGIPIFSRSEVLGAIAKSFTKCVAVSGSHGKTTTTCMITEILEKANYNPTSLIGGESLRYGNFRSGDSDYVVVEACEYQKNFLNIKPYVSVVLNIDDDHLDTYGTLENEIQSFSKFCEDSLSVINRDDENAYSVKMENAIYYSTKRKASIRAKYIKFNGKGYSFTLYLYGVRVGRINLRIKGKHNVYNALASTAVCVQLGVKFKDIKNGLENYMGVKRRDEYVGAIGKTEVFTDYAHHPTEIEAIIKGLSSDTLVIFQPHTYSRTKFLMKDFVGVLSKLCSLIIYKTYPAREKKDEEGSAYTLYSNLKKVSVNEVLYSDDERALSRYLRTKSSKYRKIIFVGAGDIYEIAKKIVKC